MDTNDIRPAVDEQIEITHDKGERHNNIMYTYLYYILYLYYYYIF